MNALPYWQSSNRINAVINNIIADGGTVDSALFLEEYNGLHPIIQQKSSLIVSGGAYKTGVVYGFNPPTSALIPFTFTRTGTATRTNKDGLIEPVSVNVPRMDYNPVTKKFKGLLMEKGSSNQIFNSQALASWTKINGPTVTANYAASCIAGVNAARIQTAAAVVSGIYTGNLGGAAAVASTAYTGFVMLKYLGGASLVRVGFPVDMFNAATGDQRVTFDLVNKTFSAINASLTAYGYEDLVDGWIKVYISCVSGTTPSGSGKCGLFVYSDGNVNDFLAIGGQVEPSPYPTSYIPTTTAVVSRGQDVCSSSLGVWYDPANSSLYGMAQQSFDIPSPSRGVFGIALDVNNRFVIYRQVNTKYASTFCVPSLANAITGGVTTPGQYWKQAGSFGGGFFTGASFWNIYGIDTVTTIDQSSMSVIHIGNSYTGSAEILDGVIKSVAYFPTRLSNTELQSITI